MLNETMNEMSISPVKSGFVRIDNAQLYYETAGTAHLC
jgi:hypothetical protein